MNPRHLRALPTRPIGRGPTVAILALLFLAIWAMPPATRAAQAPRAPSSSPLPALHVGPTVPGALGSAFAAAGAEWSVPPALLEAIGYVESHWEGRQGAPNDYYQIGVMGLRVPPGGQNLARAAALLHLPPATLEADDSANIRGAAALLHALASDKPAASAGDLAPWYDVVARYSEISDPVIARSYAFSVFSVLQQGVQATTSGGETLRVAAHPGLDLPDRVDPLAGAPLTDDYPPAHWVPAATNNFQYGRPYGPLNFIVIHDTEGNYQAAISWFQNPASGVSAHYVIRSVDGDITQMVHNADTAYHAGNWDYNVRAIGVEHEGYMSQPGWYTQAMYNASAALVRTMADRFSILKDHAHIVGHYQIPNQRPPAHVDPGPNWDWASYLALVRQDWNVAARVRNSDPGFTAFPGIIDQAHGWSVYGGGWNGGQAYRALSTIGAPSNSATWSTGLPNAGLYDVYAYIPWVDNGRHETTNAHYTLSTANGSVTVTVNQKALTDAGALQGNLTPEGEWADLGRFNLSTWSTVSLNNATGDSNLNVWFDTIMWIPSGAVASPTPVPTDPPAATATPVPTNTPTWTPTWTPTDTPTWTPVLTDTPTDTPVPTWTPGPCGMRFLDLPDTDWSYNYVAYLYCHGIISGYGDGTFRGGATATRGQLAKMLVLGMGWTAVDPLTPTFSDVPPTSPYFHYVETAHTYGVVSGYQDGTFQPYNSITRAQLSKMIVIAKNWAPLQPPAPSFGDVPPDSWAYGFVEAVHAQGVVSGYADGSFRPGNPATRAQLSRMLSNAFQLPDGPTATPTPVPTDTATATDTQVASLPTTTGTPGTPTATGTPVTATPSVTGTPATATPSVTGTSPTATPIVLGTDTPEASETAASTSTPQP